MSEIIHPVLEKKKIIKALIIALVIAVVLLVTAVLPAEYGIDPTGAGKAFGFNRLHISKDSLLAPTDADTTAHKKYPLIKMEKAGSGPDVPKPKEADNPPPQKQFDEREDSVQVIVPAGKGIEYKTYMLKYGKLKYEWVTDKSTVYFDFHGEVHEANPSKNVYFESYTISNSHNMVGTFLAPFEGKHGWYFRNKGTEDITVTLRLKGQYTL
jgi:hypothetical protein